MKKVAVWGREDEDFGEVPWYAMHTCYLPVIPFLTLRCDVRVVCYQLKLMLSEASALVTENLTDNTEQEPCATNRFKMVMVK